MRVRLYAMTCGWLTMPLGNFLRGEEGTVRVPVPSYLIDHPQGKVLFDSGMHPQARTNEKAYLGGRAKYIRVHMEAADEIDARLEGLEIDVTGVRYLINSHLHFDHAGGNAQIPDAPLVIQRREWEAGRDPDLIHENGYFPGDYDTGHDVVQVEGEHDLFGDGSVVCLPTYGHTPGHQSLRVRLQGGDVILAGDACYLRRTLEDLHLPRRCHDDAQWLESLKALRRLQARGGRIFYGHDPDFWKTVPQAPAPVSLG